MEENEEEVN